MTVPHDREPDGSIWLPHHFWLGLVVMLGGWLAWGSTPLGWLPTVVGLYIVADDVLEHAFGWPMPLDRGFRWFMQRHPRVREKWVALFVK